MAKTYKSISYSDRMRNPKHKFCCVPQVMETYTYVSVEEVKDNKVTKRLKKVISHTSDMLKKYRVNDFCLQNLLAIGAPLNPAHLNLDQHTALTVAETQLENITKSINTKQE